MKLSIFAVLLFTFQVNASVYSQTKRFDLTLKNVSIKQVFKSIEAQSNFRFFYNDELIDLDRQVTLNTQNLKLEEVLTKLFDQSAISFKVLENNLIVVTPSGLISQQQKISGTITDGVTGEPIIGANIIIEGTTQGVITDISGKFNIDLSKADAILVISYVGYMTERLPVNGQSVIDVKLMPDITKLEEVVVVAYGSQSKRNVTGSIQTVGENEIASLPVGQISQKLQGKLAGVQITQTTGVPGAGMSVRIRGAASINAGSDPLYVVDGFPITGDISAVNPDEIENISILKDASSTSLYGSRAANGVVLVTTKHALANKSSISFSSYYGFQSVPQKGRPDMMNAQEFAQFKKDVAEENGATVDAKYQVPTKYGKGTDWYDAILNTATIQNHSLSINFNKGKVSSNVIIGFFNQDGVVRNSNYKRFSLRANTDYKVNDYVKVGINIAPTFSNSSGAKSDGVWYTTNGIIQGALLTSPLAPVRNADGTMPINAGEWGNDYGSQPAPNWVNMLNIITNTDKTNRLLSNAYLEISPVKGLTYKSSINAELNQANHYNFTPSQAGGFFNPGSDDASRIHADVANSLNYTWLWENTLNFKRSIGKNNFDVLAGYTAQYYKTDYSAINFSGFPDNKVQTINAATVVTLGGSNGIEEWSLLSYVGRLNYNFDNKYMFSAAIRSDGSSRFGFNKRYGVFPSVSAGWVISEESFIKAIKAISNLKVRVSYGTIGNNNIGNYTSRATVVATNYPFNNALAKGRVPAGLSNSKLSWETSVETDFGVDLGLFDNRITFNYDYYKKTTSDLLYNVDIPISSGFFNYWTNIGKLEFSGHEFTLNTLNLVGELKWSTAFSISFNKNKVLALGTANANIYGDMTITKVGQPIGQLYGYVFEGVVKTQAEFDASAKYTGMEVGMVKFKDVSGDGKMTFDNTDKAVLGKTTPNFIFGMTNTFTYKGIELSAVISGQQGNKLANRIEQFTENLDGAFNVTKDVANHWRSETNPGNNRYGKLKAGTTSYERDNASSRMVYDASFLTIKNITLGYNIPVKGIKYITNCHVYVSGQQLFVFTKYPGSNPEVSGGGDGNSASAINQGSDYSSYPVPRTISMGINLGF